MPRVKRGLHHSKRRSNILKHVKGFEAGRKSLLKLARTAQTKAGAHAYRDRRVKKRLARNVWTLKINAAAKNEGTVYSRLIAGLKAKKINLDRKVLSQIAEHYPQVFAKLVAEVK